MTFGFLLSLAVAAGELPEQCAPPATRDVAPLTALAQRHGALSVGLDSVATWCFDGNGGWTGGVAPKGKKGPTKKEKAGENECLKAQASCEKAKAELSPELRGLVYEALADLERPYLGARYTPKRSGLAERPSEQADCHGKVRSDLFAQAQARMDLARLASQAQSEYANYRTWLYSQGLACADAVARAQKDPTRKGISLDSPVAVDGGALAVGVRPAAAGGQAVVSVDSPNPTATTGAQSGASAGGSTSAGPVAGRGAAGPSGASGAGSSGSAVAPTTGSGAPGNTGAVTTAPGEDTTRGAGPSSAGQGQPAVAGGAASATARRAGPSSAGQGQPAGAGAPERGGTVSATARGAGPSGGQVQPAGDAPASAGPASATARGAGPSSAGQGAGTPASAGPASVTARGAGGAAPSSGQVQPAGDAPASAGAASATARAGTAAPSGTSGAGQATGAGVVAATRGGADQGAVARDVQAGGSAQGSSAGGGGALAAGRTGPGARGGSTAVAVGSTAVSGGVTEGAPPTDRGAMTSSTSAEGPESSMAARERALASPMREKWRYFAVERARLEVDPDWATGFLASRELRDCKCPRLQPADVVRRLEAKDGLPQLEADDPKNTRCELCLTDAYPEWKTRAKRQCALMDQLSDYELGVLERSDDGNGLPPRCFAASRAHRPDAGASVTAVASGAAGSGGFIITRTPEASAVGPATAPSREPGVVTVPVRAPDSTPPTGVAPSAGGGFVAAQDYAPVPVREEGRVYVRVFMSSACVADLEPGPVQARTGDLLPVPLGAKALTVSSPCGGMAEVYFGKEEKPRVSETFGKGQPLQLRFAR